MDQFQEFVSDLRPQHFAAGLPLTLLVNTSAMWFTTNHFLDLGEKVTLLRAFICAALLYVVSTIAVLLLMFPMPLVFIAAVLFWLIGSIVVLRSVLELTDGGAGALFAYLFVLLGIHALSHLPVHYAILKLLS